MTQPKMFAVLDERIDEQELWRTRDDLDVFCDLSDEDATDIDALALGVTIRIEDGTIITRIR